MHILGELMNFQEFYSSAFIAFLKHTEHIMGDYLMIYSFALTSVARINFKFIIKIADLIKQNIIILENFLNLNYEFL